MLQKCPDSPNCICSMYKEDTSHYGEPIVPAVSLSKLQKVISAYLKGNKRVEILKEESHYIHASFKVPFTPFIDDVEFYFSDSENLLHYRSASRKGYGDLGVNKARINKIKKFLKGESLI